MAVKTFILDIMEGRRKGRSVLRLISYLYRSAVFLRNLAYDCHLLRIKDAGIPVVSIGNVVAGGTGKTPLVYKLAEELSKTKNVAIVSRGYMSEAEQQRKNFRVDPQMDPHECGDEPLWLARQLPKAQVWVGKDRFKSAQLARENGADLVILDDGMQHRQLKRDIEIVVVDGETPLFYLPRGFLRDSPHRIRKAHLVASYSSIFSSKVPTILLKKVSKIQLEGKKVAAFCAIGKPTNFLQTVKEAGGEVVATFFKPDHEPFLLEELEIFLKKSHAEYLVCTEKDRIKLPEKSHLPIISIPIQLEICQGEEAWQQMVIKLKLGAL